mgnify:CR=1 FL=1
MTLTELVAFYLELTATHLSPYKSSSDANNVSYLNRAYDRIARYIRYFDPKIAWTLTASTKEYAMSSTTIFSKRVIKPYNVYLNSQEIRLYSLKEFTDRYTDYRWNDTAGTPTVAYWHGGTLGLHVKPDSSAAAYTCYVSGECLPVPLSASSMSSVPDIPADLHESIAYLAAIYSSESTASDEVALLKLKTYSSQALIDLNIARDRNEELILGSFENEEEYIS